MRIYSNILLSWPQVLHVAQAARLYPGRWQNYYFYRIKYTDPTLVLKTYSPIELLQENSKYYCYDRYNRDQQLEKFGNELKMVHIHNNQPTFSESYVYTPKNIDINDILVIQSDIPSGLPSLYNPFKTPEPTLA
jgi:hypothetical protein